MVTRGYSVNSETIPPKTVSPVNTASDSLFGLVDTFLAWLNLCPLCGEFVIVHFLGLNQLIHGPNFVGNPGDYGYHPQA
jgi:hypothetical protein